MAAHKQILSSGAALVVAGGACVVFDGELGYDPGQGIPCAGTTCDAGTSCCVAPGMVPGGWFGDDPVCSSAPACSTTDFTRLSCATPFDCNAGAPQGLVCCAERPPGSPVMSSSCTTPGDCSPTAGDQVLVLCDPKDSMPCPGGGSCGAVTDTAVLPAGYFACQ